MTADEGVLEKDSNNMKAVGHVVVKSASGSTMETPALEWNQAAQTIRTEEVVRLVQRGNVMTGKGLVSDPGLDHVTIGQADAVLTDPDSFQHEMQSLR
jgi:LPS export ABC transporter protein LptC